MRGRRRQRSRAFGGWLVAGLLVFVGAAGCNSSPGFSDQTPLYRPPSEEGSTSGERGSVMISEINFAGSVKQTDDGTTHDWDDIFIEFRNKSERAVNMTGWRLRVRGGVDRTYVLPETGPIQPNEFFVVARQDDGAFAEAADIFIEDLELGKKHIFLELVDKDERLMAVVGSEEHRIFTGGWDTVSVRSMERVQILFSNSGVESRSWHAYSANRGFETIPEAYRKFTLASPGDANSTDYSGSTSSGNFE